MVVPYRVEGNSFRADTARAWSDMRVPQQRGQGLYDVHPDGVRFAVAPAPDQTVKARRDTMVVVFNFFDELKRLAPPR